MSKKHFIILANALKSVRVLDRDQWEEDCKAIAWAIQTCGDNPRFDRLKFLEACGIE